MNKIIREINFINADTAIRHFVGLPNKNELEQIHTGEKVYNVALHKEVDHARHRPRKNNCRYSQYVRRHASGCLSFPDASWEIVDNFVVVLIGLTRKQ